MQADKGCTDLKQNDQNVENDVMVTHEDMNTWKTKTLQGKFPQSLQKNHMDTESCYCGFLQAIYIMRRKVLQLPFKNG
jgi:hypothetical protein